MKHPMKSTRRVEVDASRRPRAAAFASNGQVRRRMQRQRRQDTDLELDLRRRLHRLGLRYRLQLPVLPRRTIDIAFPRVQVAVDVRSCFWHGCPLHGRIPSSNHDWWATKLATTKQRDADTESRLVALGWIVVVVWQHDDLD